jgi:NADPH2:quinone reductase
MKRLSTLTLCMLLCCVSVAGTSAATYSVPDRMNAAGFEKAGGPEVLTIHRLPVPTPKADEVLIKVHAAGVSVWEADMRQHLGVRSPPFVLGGEGSGTIVAMGSDVHSFKLGDEVYGVTGIGFYAEYVKARADRIAPVPRTIDLNQATSWPSAACPRYRGSRTSWNCGPDSR